MVPGGHSISRFLQAPKVEETSATSSRVYHHSSRLMFDVDFSSGPYISLQKPQEDSLWSNSVIFKATVAAPSGLDYLKVQYRLVGDSSKTVYNFGGATSSGTYKVTIDLNDGDYEYRWKAKDNTGTIETTSWTSFQVSSATDAPTDAPTAAPSEQPSSSPTDYVEPEVIHINPTTPEYLDSDTVSFYFIVKSSDINRVGFWLGNSDTNGYNGYDVTDYLGDDSVVSFTLDSTMLFAEGNWFWFAGVEDSDGNWVTGSDEIFNIDLSYTPSCTETEA